MNFGVYTLRSTGQFLVRLRSTGEFLGPSTLYMRNLRSVYAMQVKFGVRQLYAGEIWVRPRSAGAIWVRLRYAGEFLGSVYALRVKVVVPLRYSGQFLCLSTFYR